MIRDHPSIYSTGLSGTIGKHLIGSVNHLSVDLANSDFHKSLPNLKACRALLHLAGVVGKFNVEKDIDYSTSVNVIATRKLAQEYKKNSHGRFIYVSSSHVYRPTSLPIRESGIVEPQNEYAHQKRLAEIALQEVFQNQENRLCIVRVFSVLDWDVPHYSLGGAIKKLTKPNSNFELKYGDDIRDFLTPKKVASALLEIAKNSSMYGIYNLCSGTETSIFSAASQMLSLSGYANKINKISKGNSEVPYLVGENAKLLGELPKLNLEWTPSCMVPDC